MKLKNSQVPYKLWKRLKGRLWHATKREALGCILADGFVRAAIGSRYTNSFCRHLGGVCLFDFGPTATNVVAQFKNWSGWFGFQQEARVAVWLEISREAASNNLMGGESLLAKWSTPENRSYQIIPGVEACHLGPIPVNCICSIVLISHYDRKTFLDLGPIQSDSLDRFDEFEGLLPPPPPVDPLILALQMARDQHSQRQDG